MGVGYYGQIIRTTNGGGLGLLEHDMVHNHLLDQNWPNPFSETTKITYKGQKSGHVTLTIFNMTGNTVSELVNAVQPVGVYQLTFDGSRLAPGIYFYRLTTGQVSETRKFSVN